VLRRVVTGARERGGHGGRGGNPGGVRDRDAAAVVKGGDVRSAGGVRRSGGGRGHIAREGGESAREDGGEGRDATARGSPPRANPSSDPLFPRANGALFARTDGERNPRGPSAPRDDADRRRGNDATAREGQGTREPRGGAPSSRAVNGDGRGAVRAVGCRLWVEQRENLRRVRVASFSRRQGPALAKKWSDFYHPGKRKRNRAPRPAHQPRPRRVSSLVMLQPRHRRVASLPPPLPPIDRFRRVRPARDVPVSPSCGSPARGGARGGRLGRRRLGRRRDGGGGAPPPAPPPRRATSGSPA
jgi:hypothetical protein